LNFRLDFTSVARKVRGRQAQLSCRTQASSYFYDTNHSINASSHIINVSINIIDATEGTQAVRAQQLQTGSTQAGSTLAVAAQQLLTGSTQAGSTVCHQWHVMVGLQAELQTFSAEGARPVGASLNVNCAAG
jgi:hypothetical protein